MRELDISHLSSVSGGGDGNVGQAIGGAGMVVGATVIAQGGVVTLGTVTGVGVGGVVTGIGAVPIFTVGLAAGGGALLGNAIGTSEPVQSASQWLGTNLNYYLGWQGGLLPDITQGGGGIFMGPF